MMTKNIGKTDKIIRYIIGVVIIVLGIYYQSWWGLLAIIPIATALTSFCGIYKIFGISTCPIDVSPTQTQQ